MNYKIYCDGATSNNGYENARGGWAYLILDENDIEIYRFKEGVPSATNNQMELLAAINGLLYLHSIRDISKQDKITVYTDSAYLANCVKQKWYSKWLVNGWINSKKEPVANKNLWKSLIPFFEAENIEFVKVKGHAGNKYNEIVDKMAVSAKEEID